MRKLATLTKMTDKGLSTWTFAFCDGVFLAYGGTTQRCKVFTTHKQSEECMFNFAKYGYKIERATQGETAPKVARPVRRTENKQLSLAEDLSAPRPEADTLVAIF